MDTLTPTYDTLSPLDRQRIESDANDTLHAVFAAAHEATGWCGDVMEECWLAGLPVLKEAMAKLVLSSRK